MPPASPPKVSWWREGLLLAALAAVFSALTWAVHPQSPAYGDALPGEGATTLQALSTFPGEILWIDARSERAFLEGHRPGALNLNEDHYEMQLEAVVFAWDPAHLVVVYCGDVECASSQAIALRLRRDLGTENVAHLEEGWEGLRTWP